MTTKYLHQSWGIVMLLLATKMSAFGQQDGLIRGVVADAYGRALHGAVVRLPEKNQATQTDSEGRFIFGNLTREIFILEAYVAGYQAYSDTVDLTNTKIRNAHIILIEDPKALEEVNVHAQYRNEDNVLQASQSALMVQTIGRDKIEQMGSRRLDEVLREQTGMAVMNDLGDGNRSVGIQMQGFSSEYITILLNGQPMGGRHGGNFDLSRISVADIERIEIIKGASCSFYGSEALGGTINIITRQHIKDKRLTAGLTYGTYKTKDAYLTGEAPFSQGNGYAYLGATYYSTDGFNVNPYLLEGRTAPPYESLGLQGRGRLRVSRTTAFNLSGRYAGRNSSMHRNYGAMPTSDLLDEEDVNATLAMENNTASLDRFITRYYFTRYASEQRIQLLENGNPLQTNNFTEYLHRFEAQHSRPFIPLGLTVSSGAGADYLLNRAEIADQGGEMWQYFAYSQANWEYRKRLSFVAGLRYDGNNIYGGKVNPTVGLTWQPMDWLTVQSSLGTGFKAPTYRQLHQQFTNLSQGYTVLGTSHIQERLAALQESGELQSIWEIASRVTDLKPETSTSWNTKVTLKPLASLEMSVNGFYNHIRNLIFSQQIGVKSNGSQLFSWFNIAQMYSKGIEAQISWYPITGLNLSAGYQFLDMKDRTVLDSIRHGQGRYGEVRAEGGIRKANTTDYFGLPGRSRHMANAQVSYNYVPWAVFASLRATYRGAYGFLDVDNNGYIDRYDIFVASHVLINASVQKDFYKNRLRLQATAENMGNYTDYLMPGQPGKVYTLGMRWSM